MKYIYTFVLLCSLCLYAEENILEIKASTNQEKGAPKKVQLLLGVIGEATQPLDSCVKKLSADMAYSGQLHVTQKTFDLPKTKQEVTDLFAAGYPLVLFVQFLPQENSLEWRLYDAMEAEMVKGRKYGRTGPLHPRWAHGISQDIWPELSQEPGIFLTKIGYIKQLHKNRKYRSQVCIADFDGSHEKVLLDMPTVYVQLSFHPDIKNPRLLVSEFTPHGIRLLMVDFKGNKKTIFGSNRSIIGASLSTDAERVVYTESGDIWKYNHAAKSAAGKHQLLVKNELKCSSAILCPDDTVIYCSDYKIYRYDTTTEKSSLIVDNALAPACCFTKNKIAFSRRIKNTLQLMLFDEKTNLIKQLTFDAGNKSDCCFSPCGNYLIYCYEKNNRKKIATLCLLTKKQQILTPNNYSYSYPAWSPNYKDLQG